MFRARTFLAALTLGGAIVATTACSPYDGDLPPRDAFFYPADLLIHPDGDTLYVLSSNFDGTYRVDLGGTISAVDLNNLSIVEESTLCVPSFGSDLMFSRTTWDDGSPRYLFASTRANDGVIALQLDPEDSQQMSCEAATASVTHTCVDDVTTLPNVGKDDRELPCAAHNIVADPGGMTVLDSDSDTVDSVAVLGTSDGEVRVINYINGEIRGEDGTGSVDRDFHVTDDDEPARVATGPIFVDQHPLTRELFAVSRFSSAMAIIGFVYWPDATTVDDSVEHTRPDDFVARGTLLQSSNLINSVSTADIRDFVFNDDGSRAWLVQRSPNALVVLDTTSDEFGDVRNTVTRRIPLPGAPSKIVRHPSRDIAWVSIFGEAEIAVIDLEAGIVTDRIPVGNQPYAMAYDENRKRLYVNFFSDHAVGVVDVDPTSATNGTLVATIREGVQDHDE